MVSLMIDHFMSTMTLFYLFQLPLLKNLFAQRRKLKLVSSHHTRHKSMQLERRQKTTVPILMMTSQLVFALLMVSRVVRRM